MNGFLAACKTAANDHSPAVCKAWQQPAGIYLSQPSDCGAKDNSLSVWQFELTWLFKAAPGKSKCKNTFD